MVMTSFLGNAAAKVSEQRFCLRKKRWLFPVLIAPDVGLQDWEEEWLCC